MSSSNAPRRSAARTALKWTLRVVGALAAFLVVGVGAVYGVSLNRLSRSYAVKAHVIPVSDDPAVIAQGRHIARIRGCDDCHGENLAGRVMIDHPMLGRVTTANLTAGRTGGALTPEAFELAVRHGTRPDGSALIVMPAQEYAELSDEDVGALYSYARSLPATTTELPGSQIRVLGHALHAAGKLPLSPAAGIAHDAPHRSPPPVAATAEYGAYIARSCTGCHMADFTGGVMPGHPPEAPPSANITPDAEEGIGTWTEDDFVKALTTGERPDAGPINAEYMPIRTTSQMTDIEKRALYRYLRTVDAKKRKA